MAHNELRPPALDTRNGLGNRFATTLSGSNDSATPGRPQLRASVRSTSSMDVVGLVPRTAAAWLARRGRITLAHAAVLAEANGLGGAA